MTTLSNTLNDFDLEGKTVLLRADLNVPAKDGKVSDTSRIDRLKPTIDHLRKAGAKTLIISHYGRPKGQFVADMSLEFLIPALKQQWNTDIRFAGDCIGEMAQSAANSLENGALCLLENVRFHPGEEQNDAVFAKELADLADIYVNDAFSAAHRAHASTVGVAKLLPSAAGTLMAAELDALTRGLENPEKPLLAIVGGAKISTKLDLLVNMVEKTDILVLGGGMANTFLYAKGKPVGRSLCEKDMADKAREIMNKADKNKCHLVLPLDGVCAAELAEDVDSRVFDINAIPDDHMMLDIGPKSVTQINELLGTARTVVWNGPLGAFETPPFGKGTIEVANTLAKMSSLGNILSVAGGGDTLSALKMADVSEKISYVSTAGGAFLEWLEGKTLPGVAALATHARAA